MPKGEHPSGRPVHDVEPRPLPIPRLPPEEPLTPGLRQRELASAIGFHHVEPEWDDEEECRRVSRRNGKTFG